MLLAVEVHHVAPGNYAELVEVEEAVPANERVGGTFQGRGHACKGCCDNTWAKGAKCDNRVELWITQNY